MVVHSISSCAVTIAQSAAANTGGSALSDAARSSSAHSFAASGLSDYYTASTMSGLAGPKFRPLISTRCIPGVSSSVTVTPGPPDSCAATIGGCYDDSGPVAASVPWPATAMRHRRSLPVPSAVVHVTELCATVTAHAGDDYGVRDQLLPLHGPYCATTGVGTDSGAQLVVFTPTIVDGPIALPPSTVASPPLVEASDAPGPAMLTSVGARYAAPADALSSDTCPPSDTRHTQCAPAPAGTEHSSRLCCCAAGVPAGTEQSVASSASCASVDAAAPSHSAASSAPAPASATNDGDATS